MVSLTVDRFQRKKLGEEIVFLKEDSKAKSEQIEDLHSRVKNLLHEVTTIRAELDKKNIEIKNFSKKTDEYLRYHFLISKVFFFFEIQSRTKIIPKVFEITTPKMLTSNNTHLCVRFLEEFPLAAMRNYAISVSVRVNATYGSTCRVIYRQTKLVHR